MNVLESMYLVYIPPPGLTLAKHFDRIFIFEAPISNMGQGEEDGTIYYISKLTVKKTTLDDRQGLDIVDDCHVGFKS